MDELLAILARLQELAVAGQDATDEFFELEYERDFEATKISQFLTSGGTLTEAESTLLEELDEIVSNVPDEDRAVITQRVNDFANNLADNDVEARAFQESVTEGAERVAQTDAEPETPRAGRTPPPPESSASRPRAASAVVPPRTPPPVTTAVPPVAPSAAQASPTLASIEAEVGETLRQRTEAANRAATAETRSAREAGERIAASATERDERLRSGQTQGRRSGNRSRRARGEARRAADPRGTAQAALEGQVRTGERRGRARVAQETEQTARQRARTLSFEEAGRAEGRRIFAEAAEVRAASAAETAANRPRAEERQRRSRLTPAQRLEEDNRANNDARRRFRDRRFRETFPANLDSQGRPRQVGFITRGRFQRETAESITSQRRSGRASQLRDQRRTRDERQGSEARRQRNVRTRTPAEGFTRRRAERGTPQRGERATRVAGRRRVINDARGAARTEAEAEARRARLGPDGQTRRGRAPELNQRRRARNLGRRVGGRRVVGPIARVAAAVGSGTATVGTVASRLAGNPIASGLGTAALVAAPLFDQARQGATTYFDLLSSENRLEFTTEFGGTIIPAGNNVFAIDPTRQDLLTALASYTDEEGEPAFVELETSPRFLDGYTVVQGDPAVLRTLRNEFADTDLYDGLYPGIAEEGKIFFHQEDVDGANGEEVSRLTNDPVLLDVNASNPTTEFLAGGSGAQVFRTQARRFSPDFRQQSDGTILSSQEEADYEALQRSGRVQLQIEGIRGGTALSQNSNNPLLPPNYATATTPAQPQQRPGSGNPLIDHILTNGTGDEMVDQFLLGAADSFGIQDAFGGGGQAAGQTPGLGQQAQQLQESSVGPAAAAAPQQQLPQQSPQQQLQQQPQRSAVADLQSLLQQRPPQQQPQLENVGSSIEAALAELSQPITVDPFDQSGFQGPTPLAQEDEDAFRTRSRFGSIIDSANPELTTAQSLLGLLSAYTEDPVDARRLEDAEAQRAFGNQQRSLELAELGRVQALELTADSNRTGNRVSAVGVEEQARGQRNNQRIDVARNANESNATNFFGTIRANQDAERFDAERDEAGVARGQREDDISLRREDLGLRREELTVRRDDLEAQRLIQQTAASNQAFANQLTALYNERRLDLESLRIIIESENQAPR